MEMIAHETIRMDLPAGLGAGFGERGEEAAVVEVVAEDGFAAVAAIHDVVDRAGVLPSQLAGRAGRQPDPVAPSNQEVVEVRN